MTEGAPSAAAEQTAGIVKQLASVAHPISKDVCASSGSELKDKVVVITGAGSGFGRSYALRAATYGHVQHFASRAKLVLSDLSLETVQVVEKEIIAAGGTATSIKCNTTSYEDQSAMFQHAIKTFGKVDVVIPNAGVPEMAPLIETGLSKEPAKPDLLPIEVNIIGVLYTVRLGFHYLQLNQATSGKAIVFLGSMSSFFGIPGAPQYTTSKHAVLGLFRTCYYEGSGCNIRASIVCPWFVHTPILKTPARLLIAGLPLATVESVVDGMIYASSNPKANGDALAIDPSGVLAVPFDTFLGISVDDNFYYEFVKRGTGAIRLKYTIHDSVLAIKRGLGFGLIPLILLAIIAPKVIHKVWRQVLPGGDVWNSVVYPLAILLIFFARR